jgi:hypothetical protein
MRRAWVLWLVPVLAQCQSEVQALRYTSFVPLSGQMETGSNAGYHADGLWLPQHGVTGTMLLPLGVFPSAGVPWRVVARFGDARDFGDFTEVRLPSALADRLVALAKSGSVESAEQVDLAQALIAAGVVSGNPTERVIRELLAR